MSIGEKIKSLRKERKLTQVELSKIANISRSYLADIENDRYNPSIETLKSIANGLSVSLSDIISDETNKNNKLTQKDQKSISIDLKKLMDEFRNGTEKTAYYEGKELDSNDLDLIESAVKIALEQIKIKNKEKYTPKKYKK